MTLKLFIGSGEKATYTAFAPVGLTCSNLVAGSTAGLALTYALGQAAPLAAMGWGVLYCECLAYHASNSSSL